MNAFTRAPKLPTSLREAINITLCGILSDDEAADFLRDWCAGHRLGVTFWMDTIAFRKGQPGRWEVPASN